MNRWTILGNISDKTTGEVVKLYHGGFGWVIHPVERPAMGRRATRYRPVTSAGPVQENRHRGQEFTDEPSGEFKAGMRVFHQKFGYGKIVATDGNKLEVSFEKAGTKKVMANYVKPS